MEVHAVIRILLTIVLAAVCAHARVVPAPTVSVNFPEATTNAINAVVSATNDTTRAELLATNAVLVTSIATKVTTNATLDKLKIGDGTVLTNMATTATLLSTNAALVSAIGGKATTNQLGGITFIMLNGTNLLTVIGTTTNQTYLAPYSP